MIRVSGDFSHGAYTNGLYNGFNAHVMQSHEYLDQLLDEFEVAIKAGYNPNMVNDEIFNRIGCTADDLTDFDRRRLIERVEAMYKSHHTHY